MYWQCVWAIKSSEFASMSHLHSNLNSRRWGAVRRGVFERDGWRCAMCVELLLEGTRPRRRGCRIQIQKAQQAPYVGYEVAALCGRQAPIL